MSTTAELPHVEEKAHQKSIIQRKNNSGELDVFEAARYFSGSNEIYGASLTLQQRMMRSSRRTSLEISKNSSVSSPIHHLKEKENGNNYKKPNSPSGKLARFLHSLFSQSSSRKKILKTSFIQPVKDDQDNENGRRKRRSSISHFRSANTNCSSHSKLSSSSFEFKTPPCTSTQTVKNSNVNVDVKSSLSSSSEKKVHVHEKTENSRLDKERLKVETFNKCSSEKYNRTNGGSDEKKYQSEIPINCRNDDDGAYSDSSSDLFELQNFDLVSCCSVNLPIYEKTCINIIKS